MPFIFFNLLTFSQYRGAVLVIIDGMGESAWPEGNSVEKSKTPTLDKLKKLHTYQSLVASQQPVGLIRNEPGSSSVGHQTLGLGRSVPGYYQQLEKAMNPNSDNYIKKNKELLKAFEEIKKSNSTLHMSGLCTDKGIFSHIKFLKPIFEAAADNGVKDIVLHCFFPLLVFEPSKYLEKLTKDFPKNTNIRIGTIHCGHHALDRFRNWNLTKVTLDAMLGKTSTRMSYDKACKYIDENGPKSVVYDPIVIDSEKGYHYVKENDIVIFFNHREDQSYQIAKMFNENKPRNSKMLPMILYDKNLSNIPTILPNVIHPNSLGSWISKLGYKQARIAEHYKSYHITDFFSGGIGQPKFDGEDRFVDIKSVEDSLIPKNPEMNGSLVFKYFKYAIESRKYKLIAVNLANVDATGHSGQESVVTSAVEYIDLVINDIQKLCIEHRYVLFITADHGNGEENTNLDGSLQIDHTVNNVPFLTTAQGFEKNTFTVGKVPFIGNVAPTILNVLGLPIPKEMEQPLLVKENVVNTTLFYFYFGFVFGIFVTILVNTMICRKRTNNHSIPRYPGIPFDEYNNE